MTDAASADGELFGDDRLAEVLKASRAGRASEILDAILLAVDTFRSEGPIPDDLTLVVLKRLSAAGPSS